MSFTFHTILDCKFTKVMWKRIEKTLLKIVPKLPTLHERAFGLQPTNSKQRNPVILRNWITFSMRHHIMLEERKAYYMNNYTSASMQKFFINFNYHAQEELKTKRLQYDFQGLSRTFKEIVTVNNAIVTIVDGDYIWKDIM